MHRKLRLAVLTALLILTTLCLAGCFRMVNGRLIAGDLDGLVKVISNPPGALITLDGEPTQYETPSSLRVPEGRHRIEFDKIGYVHAYIDMDVPYSETVTAELDLVFDPSQFGIELAGFWDGDSSIVLKVVTTRIYQEGDIAKVTFSTVWPEAKEVYVDSAPPFECGVDLTALTGNTRYEAVAEDAYGNQAGAGFTIEL